MNAKVVCPFCFGKGEITPCPWGKDCQQAQSRICRDMGLKKRPVCHKLRDQVELRTFGNCNACNGQMSLNDGMECRRCEGLRRKKPSDEGYCCGCDPEKRKKMHECHACGPRICGIKNALLIKASNDNHAQKT